MKNFANLMSFRSISQASGLSVDTAGEYLSYLEKAFMVSINKKFTRSSKGQMRRSSPVKVYATDLGMANSLMMESMDNKGRWAETLAANQMSRTTGPMYYWRNGHEVDLLSPKTKEAVQVCYGNERENELKAFEELPFKGYAKTLITRDEFDISRKVKRVPLWTFLLYSR
jgi:predicted AAA+ superfamily ATPase